VTYRPGPRDLRASDFDRERVIALLGESAADGRLTPEEHTERVERAYQARTLGELAVLTTDLATPSGQPIRLDGRRAVAAIFGHDSRDGRWVVPESLPVVAVFGEAELDLRQAILQGSRTVIYATVVLGTLHVIVPDGVSVEVSGTAVLTRKISRTVRQAAAQRQPGSVPGMPDMPGVGPAVIDLRTMGIGGTIRVTSPRPPRRLGGLRRGLIR
jgi:Domain of unknown function (DUF1707)/Cell wall-active antibiotics response 4TMS YvqF